MPIHMPPVVAKAGKHGAKGFNVGQRARFIAPEGFFVRDAREQRAPSHGPKTRRVHGDGNATSKPDLRLRRLAIQL